MINEDIESFFPKLQSDKYTITSPNTPDYNCIAWAAGEIYPPWWPDEDHYWPEEAICENTIEAFISAFELREYKTCDNPDYENNFEKVALFVDDNNVPTHMARQLDSDTWTSKLGKGVDIIHSSLEALEGKIYGKAKVYLKRPKKIESLFVR
jgi:hypothetical protein